MSYTASLYLIVGLKADLQKTFFSRVSSSFIFYSNSSTASISTCASFGSDATPSAARAG